MTKFLFQCVIGIMIVSGCGLRDPAATSREAAERCTVERDPYRSTISITGPSNGAVRRGGLGCDFIDLDNFLRVTANKEGKPLVFQLYVSESVTAWRFYASATRLDGAALPLVPISRNVSVAGPNVLRREDFAVDLSPEDSPLYCQQGISFQAYGTGGQVAITIPAHYFQGFLDVAKREGVAFPEKK